MNSCHLAIKFCTTMGIFTLAFSSLNGQIRQRNNNWDIEASFGIQQSIGKDVLKTKQSTQNPSYSYEYYSQKKYKYPAMRLRINSCYPVLHKHLLIGLQTGVTIHYGEIYYSGSPRTTFSFPIQAALKFPLFLRDKIFINVYPGIHVMYVSESVFTDKTGGLFTGEISYRPSEKLSLNLGFEYQIDNCEFYLNGANYNPPLESETIKTKQHRPQIYVSASFSLF